MKEWEDKWTFVRSKWRERKRKWMD
jgi:hypothetical protein